ncbi:MAG: transglycosylase domain-containing protein [Bdellovibrionaceae bacterium]|nr:transglycosylase domain-containing protein [Pseudobdellovibrionaceae bacterium]
MATSKKVLSAGLIIIVSLGIIGTVLGAATFYAYQSIPNIDNIDGCFKTSMFNVDLCPKKSGYVRYSSIPKHLVNSLIAAEDASFYFHQGFDMEGIQDAFEKSMDAGRWVRGGSTITQQLAKNLYLSKEKSLVRKIKELILARSIEKKISKTKIIEKYFNVVEFGPGLYGISKASYHYFSKPPSALTPAEGAYLVSLLPSPIRYSASFRRNKELSNFNKRRVKHILRILNLQKKINDDDYNYEVARTESGLWNPAADDLDAPTILQRIFGDGEAPTTDAIEDMEDPTEDEDLDF